MNRLDYWLAVLIPATIILCGVAVAGFYDPSSIPLLTRDLAAQAGVNPLTGSFSALGIFIWIGTGGICIFSGWNVKSDSLHDSSFLIFGGIISLYVGLDDFFMIHENLAPVYLGISELVVYGGLAVLSLIYLTVFYKKILSFNYLSLASSLLFLSSSVVFDLIIQELDFHPSEWHYFFEDGLKWIGTVLWSGFHISTASHLIKCSSVEGK
jgi:hypothetical protein